MTKTDTGTPTGVRILRSSQGSDDKVSLEVQDETTRELAAEHGVEEDNLTTINLGIHTGFSLSLIHIYAQANTTTFSHTTTPESAGTTTSS